MFLNDSAMDKDSYERMVQGMQQQTFGGIQTSGYIAPARPCPTCGTCPTCGSRQWFQPQITCTNGTNGLSK